ncbi:Putative type IV pilus assembly FimV-related transmembrane protein [Minicystis rosea]|nr:Putative type IV pilus assembly FimV-related transmembrane protein [Minicystis rosea]
MSGTIPSTVAIMPLAGATAAAVAWRWRGQLWITVIAKATFAFASDAAMSRIAPDPILATEIHHGQNPGRSIRAAGDLAPHLARADVLFAGSAHAPDGTRQMHVRLALFAGERPLLDKWLLVQDPAGFTRMPIVYEHALRGPTGADNPFGLAANAHVVDPAHPTAAAGFGPIARTWPARKRLLGALPRKKLEGAIAEIPDDFDWSYYQAAPPDQQTDLLRGDEWIVLEGLSASALLRTRLPDARGVARLHGLSAFGIPEGQPLALTADTLSIDGDEQRCAVVWRKSFAVPSEAALAAARIVAGIELPGEPVAWPDPRAIETFATVLGAQADNPETIALFSGSASTDDPATIALLPFAAPASAVPFRPGAPSVPTARIPVEPAPSTGTFMLDPARLAPTAAALPFDAAPPSAPAARAALPFQPAPAVAPPMPPRAPVEHVPTGTLAVMGAPSATRAPLPFAAPMAPPAPMLAVEPPPLAPMPAPAPIPEPELELAPVVAPAFAVAPEPVAAPAHELAPAPAPVAAPIAAEPPASPWAPAPPVMPAPAPAPPPPRPALPAPSPALKNSLYDAFKRKGS